MATEKSSAPAHHPEVAAGDPFVAAGQRDDYGGPTIADNTPVDWGRLGQLRAAAPFGPSINCATASDLCPACYDGLVYIGHLETTEEGEEAEVIEAVPCRRCQR